MIFNLLANSNWSSYIMLIVLFGVMIVFMIFSRRSQKKREQEVLNIRNAIKPGNKVTTIGGIVGVVTEVLDEENAFVLETGTDKSGKSYIKFDKQAIYTTDAVVKKEEAKTEDKKSDKEEK